MVKNDDDEIIACKLLFVFVLISSATITFNIVLICIPGLRAFTIVALLNGSVRLSSRQKWIFHISIE